MATQEEINYQLAHIDEDRSEALIVSHTICLVLAGFAIVLRLIARRMSKAAIKADDYMIIVAFFLAAGEVCATMICVRAGGGKHAIVSVMAGEIQTYAKSTIATEVFYCPAIACVKFSVLLLYRRIFPNRGFRIIIWSLGAFIVCYSLVLFFGIIFQCKPIRGAWDPTVEAKCIDLGLIILITSALNVFTDVSTLCLPLPLLWKLNLPKERKVQLTGIFLLGGFVCIASLYRTTQVNKISLQDAPWSDVDGAIWSIVECCVGIFSACLPLFLPIFNKIIGLRSKSSTTPKRSHYPTDAAGVKIESSNSSWPRAMRSSTKASDERLCNHHTTDIESNRGVEM